MNWRLSTWYVGAHYTGTLSIGPGAENDYTLYWEQSINGCDILGISWYDISGISGLTVSSIRCETSNCGIGIVNASNNTVTLSGNGSISIITVVVCVRHSA